MMMPLHANHFTLLTVFTLCMFFIRSSLLYCSARDSITRDDPMRDGETPLVSACKNFELGFFTPPGNSSHSRYVGIWYYGSTPPFVVWVANRDNPFYHSSGVLAIDTEDGNLKLQDREGNTSHPISTSPGPSSSSRRKAKLMDSGNLVLIEEDDKGDLMTNKTLWQSFEHPTDTFLPGMRIDQNMTLVSWKSVDDPGTGSFCFKLYQVDEPGFESTQYIILKNRTRYWKSGVTIIASKDYMLNAVGKLLNNSTQTRVLSNTQYNFTHLKPLYNNNATLVIRSSGEIQYLTRYSSGKWYMIWSEPRDRCSTLYPCGRFRSCSVNYGLMMCKCLPGFQPAQPQDWYSREYSDGCRRKSELCGGKGGMNYTFLNLKMMDVGHPDDNPRVFSEKECREQCLKNCQCVAYSYDKKTVNQRGGNNACSTWFGDLNNLQENIPGGLNLSVKIAVSDTESIRRNCNPCGTNMIPYPLSTAQSCGDSAYRSFSCDDSTGQVSFQASTGTHQVIGINPEAKSFAILVRVTGINCAIDLPFNKGDNALVEIGWKPPVLEPSCASSADCKDWPNSTCNFTRQGSTKRCICNAKIPWNGSILNCSRVSGIIKSRKKKFSFPLIIVMTSTILVALVALSCTIVHKPYLWRRSRTNTRQEVRAGALGNPTLRLFDSETIKGLMDSGHLKKDDKNDIDVPFFHFKSILDAKDNFSDANKLGQGGFGPVYKGKFPGGHEIAVKRLSSASGQGLREFMNEVVLIAKLQHRNLVRLLGYCIKGGEKILLYEHMPNKSLDTFIFDQSLCLTLKWEKRFEIILGIARGLLYLHQDSRLRIIHRDLKTSNILLDEEMNPKISDFGLARIFGGKQTEANTNRVVGTYGYMSPEYALDGIFSIKSDVFSFGVVLLEIISGRKNTGFYQSQQALSLLGYAWRLWIEERALDLVDQVLRQSCDISSVLKCINVGLICVQEDPSDRPTMSDVIVMLGGETITLPTPKQPAFIVRRGFSNASCSSSKPQHSVNKELTVTKEEGR
ncbi:G-type lectin S-receptor-like serine/threonine-protein kinase At4g03230 isoform X2 [Malania oleifera]|uniref:G-type lectin S-receptor-like serine/threonine-protein kinase At4g03230 isoform X2 n=1 Tax=Malania oleifera TaxID=397392 RepID=UPI0025AE3782|nr:G-type lectin S-receptor-like serine/threonine-protein kinase At4g03230 isoform X2 [Malania oleifera]